MDKDTIVEAVRSEKCPMLDHLNMKEATKKEIVKALTEACCPVLEKLAGMDK
jgi:hypothetical protein